MTTAEHPGPLSGIRIIDMSSVVLGPFATLILADLGADVLKIEPPDRPDTMRLAGASPTGDLGPIYMALNRNKQAITLDVRTEEGKTALSALLGTADVFFHNVRMAGMERLGFGYEEVRRLKPDIVYVHCAGFGRGGAYEHRQAYDDLIQAASGFADLNAIRSGGRPEYAPSLVADKTVGLFAAYATLAALFHRERSGHGQFVEVPMLESFTFFNMVENLYGETFLPGNGKLAYTRSVNPNRRPYPTKDGFIGLVPYSDEQWEKFFEIGGMRDVFKDPRFANYQARTENVGALYALIEQISATRTTEEWLALMDAANIPAMRYNTMQEVLSDPHLTSTGFFAEAEHPEAGPFRMMRHPVSFSKTPASVRRMPPRPGADNETILSALGLGEF